MSWRQVFSKPPATRPRMANRVENVEYGSGKQETWSSPSVYGPQWEQDSLGCLFTARKTCSGKCSFLFHPISLCTQQGLINAWPARSKLHGKDPGRPPPPQHPWRTSPWENASTNTLPETPMRLHLLRGIKRVICYLYPQGFLNLSLWGNRCPPIIKTLNYPHLTTVHSIRLCKTVV